MRALDVFLGLGAVGAAIVAAKLIADASKPTKASLPENVPSGAHTGPIVDRGPASPINTGAPTGSYFPWSEQAASQEQATTGCAPGDRVCWCWGAGWGTPECADFDYSQSQSVMLESDEYTGMLADLHD